MRNLFINTGTTRTVLITALLLLSGQAMADISNCQINISPAEQNYGSLLKGNLTFTSTAQGNVTQLSERTSNLSVTCPQPERMDLRFTGISLGDSNFGFGAQGKVKVKLSSAVLDGKAVKLAITKHKGVIRDDIVADSHDLYAADEITVGDNSSVKGMNLNATLTVTPFLLEAAFRVTDAYQQEEIINAELLAVN